jgi:hypothetical protein
LQLQCRPSKPRGLNRRPDPLGSLDEPGTTEIKKRVDFGLATERRN